MNKNNKLPPVPKTRKAAEEFIRSIATTFSITMLVRRNKFRAELLLKLRDRSGHSASKTWEVGDATAADKKVIELAVWAHKLVYVTKADPRLGLAESEWIGMVIERWKNAHPGHRVPKELISRYKSLDAAPLRKYCLNGCGHLRENRSEYCSGKCRNTLWKWIAKQAESAPNAALANVTRKVQRFAAKI